MIYKKIKLGDINPLISSKAFLKAYLPENSKEYSKERKRECVLLFPGGGYEFVSDRENEPIAFKLLANDIAVFSLTYTIIDFRYPYPFIEAFAALAYIRENAEKYNINPSKISLMGFSAGGHLASFVSCHSEDEFWARKINKDPSLIKVNGVILGYPVTITSKNNPLCLNLAALQRNMPEHAEELDILNNLTSSFPKTFIWTTQNDGIVPSLNSIDLVKKLTELNVFCEFHLFPKGEHGLSTADEIVNKDMNKINPLIKEWMKHAIYFIKNYL